MTKKQNYDKEGLCGFLIVAVMVVAFFFLLATIANKDNSEDKIRIVECVWLVPANEQFVKQKFDIILAGMEGIRKNDRVEIWAPGQFDSPITSKIFKGGEKYAVISCDVGPDVGVIYFLHVLIVSNDNKTILFTQERSIFIDRTLK